LALVQECKIALTLEKSINVSYRNQIKQKNHIITVRNREIGVFLVALEFEVKASHLLSIHSAT
jgi:hypothetical protein